MVNSRKNRFSRVVGVEVMPHGIEKMKISGDCNILGT